MLPGAHRQHDGPPFMAQPTGIDILCDAAGSDLASASFHSESQQQQQHLDGRPLVKRARTGTASEPAPGGDHHHHRQQQPTASPHPSVASPSGSQSTSSHQTPSSQATPTHVCHLCKRVYERADHLTRHLRSHENARPYQCSRCPKRFNRADLLARHESTHNRETEGTGRPMIRRTDRAVEACTNCAASKAKCEDQKPCSRCSAKNVPCEMPQRKVQKYKTISDVVPTPSSSASSTVAPHHEMPYNMPYGIGPGHSAVPTSGAHQSGMLPGISDQHHHVEHSHPNVIHPVMSDETLLFNPMQNLFQDMDFTSWDFTFPDLTMAHYEAHRPSPQSTGTTTNSSRAATRGLRDTARRHAAFKQSPWLWEPENPADYVQRDTEGIHLNEEETLARSPVLTRSLIGSATNLKMTAATRDRLFAIVLAEIKKPGPIPTFPSLELLDYLLQTHFVHAEYYPTDSWIHAPSFDPQNALSELLGAIISCGASFVSTPSVWQFGLALQEIVRQRLGAIFESNNSNTRRLECLQTYMLSLNIGMWSGFKRRTEISESFLQPMVTMIRRGGIFAGTPDSPWLIPSASDPPEVLDAKWRKFITRESYKRLAMYLFLHDVQTSIALQKPPLVVYNELTFSLPAALDLWRAPSAEAWRATYLSKPRPRPETEDSALPRVSNLMQHLHNPDNNTGVVDLDLCYAALLHGFWGQISAYRGTVKYYRHHDRNPVGAASGAIRRPWLESQQQELYADLCSFSSFFCNPNTYIPELAMLGELLKMILHVSLEDLQTFAGKAGEDEARRISLVLEDDWIQKQDARCAAWHAGQVLRFARQMPPASLRAFNAMAVYFASITLWVYGVLANANPGGGGVDDDDDDDGRKRPLPQQMVASTPIVVLDSEDMRGIPEFLQYNRGTPGLRTPVFDEGDTRRGEGVEALSDTGTVLGIARRVLRDNFPVADEPLPPLVESLTILLRDLGSGAAGQPSRAGTEE